MKSDVQWTEPFSMAGIEKMADWMAPRIRRSPIYRIAIGSRDADLLAVMLADLMTEYLAEIKYDARVRCDRNFVIVSTGEDDESRREHNISIPLTRAILQRLHGPGPYGAATLTQPFL